MVQPGIKNQVKKEKVVADEYLYSSVVNVKNVNPLLFFAAGKTYFQGERFFWTNPENTTIFVGLGYTHSLVASDKSNRFSQIESDWKRLIEGTDSDCFSYGSGPLLFGGFSFDPKKKKTGLWDSFPDAKFVLPTIMLSVVNGESRITINTIGTNEEHSLDGRLVQTLITEAEALILNKAVENYQKSEIEPEEWKKTVEEAAKNIRDGEVEKVVLAREIRVHFHNMISTETVLNNLYVEQPFSYLFAFENGNDTFIGASPERLVKKEHAEILSTCLAGSIRRGKTDTDDKELEHELLSDQKNLIEHDVVVQMIREAMKKSCINIETPEGPQIYKMRDIQHLYTPIKGEAKTGVSLLSMVKRLHPTPALGGFPKEKAVEKIREVELLDRGWYAGPIGWIDANDNGEFAVAIRSGLLQGKEASLFAGCGIVGDSNPESEYKETNIKFKPMLTALGGMNNGEN